jgi:hypothetical protein
LENATLHRDLAAALEIILNHKMAIQSKIKNTEERVMICLEEMEAMPVPSNC